MTLTDYDITKDFNFNIHWQCKAFSQLNLDEWYAISQAREQVFIVEQNCPYLDSDGQDLQAWHSLGYSKINETEKLACYARILPPALHFSTGQYSNIKMPAIGRVLTVNEFRRQGLAGKLMQFAIAQSYKIYGQMPIYISAQVYLLDFYQSLGFIPQGESYLEDNISHQAMVRC